MGLFGQWVKTVPALLFWEKIAHVLHLQFGDGGGEKIDVAYALGTWKWTAGFGWTKHPLPYTRLWVMNKNSLPSRTCSCGCDGSDPILSFSHGSGGCEIILVCWSEMPRVVMGDLRRRGQESGSRACHLSKKQTKTKQTRFKESIVSEWDNSREFEMKRVSGLEYRCCLTQWRWAVGEKRARAASGNVPHYSCFRHH